MAEIVPDDLPEGIQKPGGLHNHNVLEVVDMLVVKEHPNAVKEAHSALEPRQGRGAAALKHDVLELLPVHERKSSLLGVHELVQLRPGLGDDAGHVPEDCLVERKVQKPLPEALHRGCVCAADGDRIRSDHGRRLLALADGAQLLLQPLDGALELGLVLMVRDLGLCPSAPVQSQPKLAFQRPHFLPLLLDSALHHLHGRLQPFVCISILIWGIRDFVFLCGAEFAMRMRKNTTNRIKPHMDGA